MPMGDQQAAGKALGGIWRRVKSAVLIALFLLVPFAGAFHPKLRKRQDPEEKEIGAGK